MLHIAGNDDTDLAYISFGEKQDVRITRTVPGQLEISSKALVEGGVTTTVPSFAAGAFAVASASSSSHSVEQVMTLRVPEAQTVIKCLIGGRPGMGLAWGCFFVLEGAAAGCAVALWWQPSCISNPPRHRPTTACSRHAGRFSASRVSQPGLRWCHHWGACLFLLEWADRSHADG